MRANRCGIQPQSRLAAPSVHYFILFYLDMYHPKTHAGLPSFETPDTPAAMNPIFLHAHLYPTAEKP